MATKTSAEQEVLETLEQWNAAMQKRDAKGVVAHLSPDHRQFSQAPPLQTRGIDQAGLQSWFDTWSTDLSIQVKDQDVEVNDNLAVVTALVHMSGTKKESGEAGLWFRSTIVLKKDGDRWLISHTHDSVPFYMDGSFKAAVDLKP